MSNSSLIKPRILVVDDTLEIWDLLSTLLVPDGYVLKFAADGVAALRLAEEFRPDLILLDVQMPGWDGFEVCQRLRATPLLAAVPILFLTGLDDRESRLRGLTSGADDFLTKPFDPVELRTRVQGITRLNRYRQLLAQRAEFEWVVDQSPAGILIVDHEDAVRFANPRAVQLLDLPGSPPALVGRKFLEAAQCHYRLVPELFWQSWHALPDDPTQRFLYLLRPETPTARAFWLRVRVLDGDAGRRLIWLENRTEAVTARREVWSFQGRVSHKLRTPLNGLLGCLSLLKDDLGTLPPETAAQFLTAALASGERLNAAVAEVLQSMDRAPATRGPGLLIAAMPELAERLFAPQPREHLAISGLEQFLGASLVLSPATMETILGELLNNAVKFHPAKCPRVALALTPAPDGHLLLRVTDDGVNLTPEQRELAFTPYYQGEKDHTGEVPGMGLGLSMVGVLVLEAGGQCRLLNRAAGPGIVVELTLPLAARPT
jgi:CheY-like chemotaxis protein/signal transduction histidine kinase